MTDEQAAHADSTFDDAERRQLAAIVGPNAGYYLQHWAALVRNRTGRAGFNWAAFFLSGLWVAYRKMYRVVVILFAVILAEAVVEEVIFVHVMGKPEPPSFLSTVVALVVAIICGAYGNRWYFSHARAAVAELGRETLAEEPLLEALSKRGGTSVAASIAMLALFIAVGIATLLVLSLLPYGGPSA